MEKRKLKLAEALKEERDRLPEINSFGEKTNFEDYELAIRYLETGEYPRHYNDFVLLYGCIEDFEQMCFDYEIE